VLSSKPISTACALVTQTNNEVMKNNRKKKTEAVIEMGFINLPLFKPFKTFGSFTNNLLNIGRQTQNQRFQKRFYDRSSNCAQPSQYCLFASSGVTGKRLFKVTKIFSTFQKKNTCKQKT
jgi:hypothetical protein